MLKLNIPEKNEILITQSTSCLVALKLQNKQKNTQAEKYLISVLIFF